jgi:23S rRNA (uracil1939-C5)-methyltransferase
MVAYTRRGSNVLLNIEKLVYGGDGLARVDGRVVLAPFVLPGELVEAETGRAKNDLLRGRTTAIQTASEYRVAPPCEYFQRCGGCHYQHAAYEYQLEQKSLILREALRRVGKIEYDGEIEIVSGEPWQYRNRAQLHIESGSAGYFEAGSHRLCPIQHCPISSPRLNDAMVDLASELPRLAPFSADVELFTNETDVQVLASGSAPKSVPRGARELFRQLGTRDPIEYAGFRVSPAAFFQVNRFLIDRLVERATGEAEGGLAIDLYAGVGLFSRALKGRFARVLAVEAGDTAHRDLQFNVPDVEAIHTTAGRFLTELRETPQLIVADPPRAGLGKEAVSELARVRPPMLRIVSCDPATLARDLRGLIHGGYAVERVTLVDLFPQTFHIETVVHLRIH